jgi:hypothetical protein
MSFRYKLSKAINNIRSWHDRRRSNVELLDQVTAVIRLSHTFGLSISVARLAQREEPASYNYNCFMWAFGLLDREWLTTLIPGKPNIYPRSVFARYLVRRYLLEIPQRKAGAGDIVIYFKDGQPVHAGTWDLGLVVSKWGLYSHLWKHRLCELPIEYGDEIRFYRSLPEKIIRDAFEKWCRGFPQAERLLSAPIPQAIPPVMCTDERRITGDRVIEDLEIA